MSAPTDRYGNEIKVVWQRGKPYAVCSVCGRTVRLGKPLLGSKHVCGR